MQSDFKKRLGQAATEFIIIVAAIVIALLIVNQGCAPHPNCVAKLLYTLDENYQGYSYAVSSVQDYGDDEFDER